MKFNQIITSASNNQKVCVIIHTNYDENLVLWIGKLKDMNNTTRKAFLMRQDVSLLDTIDDMMVIGIPMSIHILGISYDKLKKDLEES